VDERTDNELVVLARKGDKDAFGLLSQRYQMIAQRLAMRLVGHQDSAQELAQEAILQAYLSLDQLQDATRFKGWLCGIVLNVCKSHLRNRKTAFLSLESIAGGLQFDIIPFSSTIATPQEIAEARELHQIVLQAVNALPFKERATALLFYYTQLSLREIATLLGTSVGAVKVRLHRVRQRLKTRLLSEYPDISPQKQRGKIMIKVTIADVVKQEWKDNQGRSHEFHVVVLHDEAGQRALPIWVGPLEGQSIAVGLGDFSFFRPLTFNFFASLLQALNAQVEQVRIEMLKGSTFYAIVKIRRGKIVSEVDARPSDALALAVLTGSPIFVAEDVLKGVGADIPKTAKTSPTRSGVENILGGIREEIQSRTQARLNRKLTQEELAKAKEELITAVFDL
jgi:RNA polymerase sigma factor (sigma-70 family)